VAFKATSSANSDTRASFPQFIDSGSPGEKWRTCRGSRASIL
jgi:hypothetical protein